MAAGDHVTHLKIFQAYRSVRGDKHWCREHFINERVMLTVLETRRQLAETADRMGLPRSSCRDDTVAIRKCLLTGLFANVAQLQGDGSYRVRACVFVGIRLSVVPSC